MKNYFLTHKIMDKKSNVLKAVATAAVLTTAPTTGIEASQIVCKTKQACELLSKSIQTQIKKIENKSEMTKDDKRLRYNLKKQLIAVEKSETKHNENLIANENDKQSRLTQVDKRLSSIEGSL